MRRMLIPALVLFLPTAIPAEAPPVERTIVQATADADLDRILVRWNVVDSDGPRFTHYDVMRRAFDETMLLPGNDEPIGALTTVAEIETLFLEPGFEDALSAIQATFGAAYASELLAIQQPEATDLQRLQRVMLPDQNYGAAVALGLGWIDDDVVNGTTYVYEVWGLDTLGFRQERLGRAVATAGSPDLLPQADAECADLGDARAHLKTFVRWSHPAGSEKRYLSSYDLYRTPADGNGDCTNPNGPGAPGAVRANAFPTQRTSVGRVAEGEELFAAKCASCHGAADPRNTPPPTGVQGGTLADFERRVHPELWQNPLDAHHDTADLRALGEETMRAIFDWIHEFHYSDDGSDTPGSSLVEGETYCYQVLARDPLGQYGSAGTQAACAALDRDPPQVPWKIQVQRVTIGGTHEACEVSWDRNDDADDDTVEYRLYRVTPDAPRDRSSAPDRFDLAGDPPLATLPHPAGGDRLTHLDATLSQADAGERFFYAVTAVDDAGRISEFSGWTPCVPRDIVAPPPTVLSLECCDPAPGTGCQDLRNDPAWLDLGGDPVLIWEPSVGNCIRVNASQPDDTFGLRLYRSFDGQSFLEGPDFKNSIEDLFTPSIDSPIHVAARSFDTSGNFGQLSNTDKWIVKALFMPAPQIVDVQPVAHVSLTGLVRIRFRSLPWTNLLGFALYRHNLETDEELPADIGTFVKRWDDNNLSTTQYQPGQWAPQVGAQPLSTFLPTGPPTSADEYLYYDVGKDLYVMQVDVQDREGLVLNLVAVGASGWESLFDPYRVGGTPNDGLLEWPEFRTNNHLSFALLEDLVATWDAAQQQVQLDWTANPLGCQDNLNRPFVVFRRRGNATRWEQISPPFGCDAGPALTFYDGDVEPLPDGTPRRHHYTIVRLNHTGEFLAQYGPVFVDVP